MDEELKGADYIFRSLSEIADHPDFSPEVYAIIGEICQMTTAEIEKFNTYREQANG